AKLAAQVPVQAPAVQVLVAWLVPGQAAPQPPQFATLFWVLISQPLARRSLSQVAKPAAQVPVQPPSVQVLVDWLVPEQAVPQPPQLATLVWVLISQPLARRSLSQSAKPAAQVPVQLPAVQVLVAWLVPGQAAPQPPQLAKLVWVLISQPLARRSL